MLNQKYRFHSRGGVRYTYKQGQTIRAPKISLIFNQNQKGGQRFAIVVSKKVCRHAVDRNRIRRRLYEAIRLNHATFKPAQDYIFVIYSRDFLEIPFENIENLVKSLATRAS